MVPTRVSIAVQFTLSRTNKWGLVARCATADDQNVARGVISLLFSKGLKNLSRACRAFGAQARYHFLRRIEEESPVKTNDLSAVLTVLLFFSTPTLTYAETVTLVGGTTVPVELTENINSRYNSTGELVYLRVTEDIKVGDKVAIPKGGVG